MRKLITIAHNANENYRRELAEYKKRREIQISHEERERQIAKVIAKVTFGNAWKRRRSY